jgi:hypothetical protein
MSFWIQSPKILFEKNILYEIIPTANMTMNEKLNALTRLILLLSLLGFLFTFSIGYLFSGMIGIVIIVIYYKVQSQKEGFKKQKETYRVSYNNNSEPLEDFLQENYFPITSKNPFGNVLLADYSSARSTSAAPSFNEEATDDINSSTKKAIVSLNKGLTEIDLFSGIDKKVEFDISMLPFYSTPATTIPNDQTAYGDYLYGDMPSCKDGDSIQCINNTGRYLNI